MITSIKNYSLLCWPPRSEFFISAAGRTVHAALDRFRRRFDSHIDAYREKSGAVQEPQSTAETVQKVRLLTNSLMPRQRQNETEASVMGLEQ